MKLSSLFVLWLVTGMAFCGCSASKLTIQDEGNLAGYDAEQAACITLYKPDRAKIDACRQAVQAKYDALWEAQFHDGGAK